MSLAVCLEYGRSIGSKRVSLSEINPTDPGQGKAIEIARELASKMPVGLKLTKEFLRRNNESDYEQAWNGLRKASSKPSHQESRNRSCGSFPSVERWQTKGDRRLWY